MTSSSVDDKIKEVSVTLNIPFEVAKKAYYSVWEFIKGKMASLPLKEEISEEEFKQLKTSFNIPSIGKLACTYDRYKSMHTYYKKYDNNTEKCQTFI